MCLAIPVRITELLDGDRALASAGGIVREIGTALVDDLQVGDYVILHVGYALSKLNELEAQKTLEAMTEIGVASEPGQRGAR
jgi:hydrogenase expression/formation protein HypC